MRFRDAVMRWWSDRAAARSFEALPVEERRGLARDVGLSSGTLGQILSRGSRAGEELGRLLAALDIEESALAADPELLHDLRATCSSCAVVKECRRHLRHRAARIIYRSYCPNAEAIGQLEGRPWWQA